MTAYRCRSCGSDTFVGRTPDDRFCPVCRRLVPTDECDQDGF